ncbi:MAG: RNA polymerase subunit sigma-70 [Planctomycetales bacterium]|nr:RNA polymerase subunit sigma-70 [Planctomycetales bacterium]
MPDGSVTNWIQRLKDGDRAAVQKLWEAFFPRLVNYARYKLQGVPRAAADEEDVALSAFNSCCLRAEQGKFPQLVDRHDLWQLLVVIAARKASNLRKRGLRVINGGGRTVSIDTLSPEDGARGVDFVELVSDEPDPALAAEVVEQCRHLLDKLQDDTLRTVALRKLEGYTNVEIAGLLNCSVAKVERKLKLIRGLWEGEMP